MRARALAGLCTLGLVAGCGVAHRQQGSPDASGEDFDGDVVDSAVDDAQPAGTWTVAVVDGTQAGHESSLVVSDGALHVAYRSSVNHDLLYAHRPAGASWQEPVIVDGGAERAGNYPSLAIDGAGTLHLSHYDFTSEDLVYASKPPGGEWSAPEIADGGGDVGVGLHSSLTVGQDGTVHVTYWSLFDAFDLMYVKRSTAGVWSVPETVDSEGTVGSYGSLDQDEEGGLHVVYMDSSDDSSSYAYRSPSGEWMPSETVATFSDTLCESQSSLAVDSSGGVHVSYFDCDLDALRYVYRPPAGGWDAPMTIDGDGAGESSSLVVDDDGGVHVSYHDGGPGRLAYAHRTPAGAWDVEVADDDSGVGQNSSLALDEDGAVHISYFDEGEQRLKHAYRAP